MTGSKRFTWKSGIALTMLAIWIGIDGFSAIAGSQVQPPRRKRRIMISPKKEPKAEETKVNVGKIALSASRVALAVKARIRWLISSLRSNAAKR